MNKQKNPNNAFKKPLPKRSQEVGGPNFDGTDRFCYINLQKVYLFFFPFSFVILGSE